MRRYSLEHLSALCDHMPIERLGNGHESYSRYMQTG